MTRWYLDTSAALKLLVDEAESAALDAAIATASQVVATYDRRMQGAVMAAGLRVIAPGQD